MEIINEKLCEFETMKLNYFTHQQQYNVIRIRRCSIFGNITTQEKKYLENLLQVKRKDNPIKKSHINY